jgi:hypothetical protein
MSADFSGLFFLPKTQKSGKIKARIRKKVPKFLGILGRKKK